MATDLDIRKYVSGALGAYFAATIVTALKVTLWATVNRLLTKANGRGISIGALSNAMSTIVEFDASILCETGFIGAASFVVYGLEMVLPSALALLFSTGFVTEQVTAGGSEQDIEISEIGGCYLGQCIATSATLLGLLGWQINNGHQLDGASLSGNFLGVPLSSTADVNLFYPDIPTEAVKAYWNNPSSNTTVFSVYNLPGLLVEARTTEISEYVAYTNKISTTVSNISLSYDARQDPDGAFRMELIGRTDPSSGTVIFLFNASVKCATADTTITAKSGILEIKASNMKLMPEYDWDNSSYQMWRSFESSLGIAIRYDYEAWFSSLRDNSTFSRHISELLGSVVAHRLSTGEATIKSVAGTFSGEITYLRDRERIATWTGYVAAGCLVFIVVRIGFLFFPCSLLHGDLLSFSRFMSTIRGADFHHTDIVRARYTVQDENYAGTIARVGRLSCEVGDRTRNAEIPIAQDAAQVFKFGRHHTQCAQANPSDKAN